MRLFIALPTAPAVRLALENTQAELKKNGVRGRFSPPENLHMTLVFLGDVPDPAPAKESLRNVPVPGTALVFDRFSLFGDVLVALYKKNEALENYVQILRAALDDAGLSYDKKAFRPHITLCRKTIPPSADFNFDPFIRRIQTCPLPVREARLIASDLSGPAPRYTTLFTQKTIGGNQTP